MSNINVLSIDENFPIAGEDNDSQGFRDNFNEIKTNLATAKSEINALEESTAKLNINNSFSNNIIQDVIFNKTVQKSISKTAAGNSTIEWSGGPYQQIIITQDLVLTLDSWPATTNYGKITLQILAAAGGPFIVTWASTGGNNIKVNTTFPKIDNQLKFEISSEANPRIFEFWTANSGVTVYGNYLGEFI